MSATPRDKDSSYFTKESSDASASISAMPDMKSAFVTSCKRHKPMERDDEDKTVPVEARDNEQLKLQTSLEFSICDAHLMKEAEKDIADMQERMQVLEAQITERKAISTRLGSRAAYENGMN
jgi:hypothetical protein